VELQRTSQAQAWWGKLALNYIITAQYIPFPRYLATTLYLILLNVFLTLFSCSIVAYSVSRLVWPGRDFVFLLMLATMMVPAQVTMIPGFLIWKSLGCYNSLVPLWLGAGFAGAFNVFLLRQFMKGIPRDVEDAARIDGCGILRVYWHIIVPLVKPTMAAIALFTIIGGWNDFKGPLLFIADQRLYSLAFGLYAFSVQVANNPAQTMAASVLMTMPVILLFFFAQKHFISGITLTGLKG
jgi:multiple sugar transport system permease protein